MESSNEPSNWIPTSFTTNPDVAEGDSLSSCQSATTPGSAAVDHQSDDQSFDAISRQKLNLTIISSTSHDRTSPKSPRVPGSMFEEDTRSSWSVEPKPTQLKETALDDDSRNSVDSQKSSVKTPNSGIGELPEKDLQLKEPPADEESENSLSSNQKSPEKVQSTWSAEPSTTESKESLPDADLNHDSIEQKTSEVPSVWNVEVKPIDCTEEVPMNEDSQNSASCPKSPQNVPNSPEASVWNVNEPGEIKESVLDEDSQISTSSQKSPEKTLDSVKRPATPTSVEPKQNITGLDEESQSSVVSQKSQSSQKSSKRQRCSDDEQTNVTTVFSAENLFEYMWPQENGEFFLLQEQICDYLNIKSFKRKYPDLARRSVDMDEKQFLKEKGIVTEMQCDLGLMALRSEEVLELMSKDYPDHYKDYIKVLREKEQQTITEKHKEFVASNSDKTKMVDLVKKAMQSAADYNAHLNQERREERRSCMDLQTYTIHYPAKKSQKTRPNTKPGKYPIALLPGQFQDYYKKYTPNELKYLPVNTVLYGPLKELQSTKALSDGSQSDSEDSSASEGSCSSSPGTHDDSSSGSEKNENGRASVSERNGTSSESNYRPKVKPNAICKVCKRGPDAKEGKAEELVHCSECDNSAHPSCIELTTDVVNVLKTYPWQCMDCKICSHCRDPNDEDKMLFCDFCDRGYHTFCVGLKSLPQGKWVCRRCGSCSICGAMKPGPETSKAQWLYDSSKGSVELDANRRPKIMCQTCFKKKR